MLADDTTGARAAQAKRPRDLQPAFAQLTIQGIPKRSVHMPKPSAQKVGPKGMWTAPSRLSA
jgi:hypothetical protein